MTKFKDIDPRNLTDDDIKDIGFLLLRCFKLRGWGNPFNYNRFFELIQAQTLGYKLLGIGGGSDGVRLDDDSVTTEFKGTEYKGFTDKGVEKSHSFSYNGTTRKPTLLEQEKYCQEKIMRDSLHHWTMIDYDMGKLVKTIQLTSDNVWKVLWPKWEKSWYNSKAADPRIGASISTSQLNKMGIEYNIIEH